jgi:hypothetical protein
MMDYHTEFENLPDNIRELIWNKFEEEQIKKRNEMKLDLVKNAEIVIAKFVKKKDRLDIRQYITWNDSFDFDNFMKDYDEDGEDYDWDYIPLTFMKNPLTFGKKTVPHSINVYVESDIELYDYTKITEYDFIQNLIDGFVKCSNPQD